MKIKQNQFPNKRNKQNLQKINENKRSQENNA